MAASADLLRARTLTAVTRHAVVMFVRRTLRDMVWTVRGCKIANPSLPPAPRSLLFVCLGNICRSPFAGLLAERLTRDHAIESASAGLRTTQGAVPPRQACDAATAYGISLDGHRPRLLTREILNASDLVVVMESGQRDELRKMYPDAAERIFLLSLFDQKASGYARYHIDDPFGQSAEQYQLCYKRIQRAVATLVTNIRKVEQRS